MSNTAIVGAQWGDEGKGKVVDLLARRFDYVVRYQGGHNAGHSVVIDGQRYALHVLPSGVFNPTTRNVIANGVVVDPFQLVKEIKGIAERGVTLTPQNLCLSDRAHIILPYHGMIDRYRDSGASGRKIGTTGRGIGPTYEWKAGRRGFRFCDIKNRDKFMADVKIELGRVRNLFPDITELAECQTDEAFQNLSNTLDILAPHVVDTVSLLADAREAGKSLLFEGAQATLLDVDFGTYPYVTSSNSCAVGISAGAGVPPKAVDRVVGICKAYATRVGEGPFPTELNDETGDDMRKAGAEFGTTTGRPRRCGWLDLVALRYAVRLNGLDTLAIMKLDVLDGFDELKVCTAYRLDGQELRDFPAADTDIARVEPVYHSIKGWNQPTTETRTFEDLPKNAQKYIAFIEEYTGCKVGLISVGPDREQTIIRNADIF